MIRLPSTMGAVDRIFRKFAQDASWLVRYVVRQRNSWRTAAVDASKRVGALQSDNAKLRADLSKTVAEREHYWHAWVTAVTGNPIPEQTHRYLMLNSSHYRAHNFRKLYGPQS